MKLCLYCNSTITGVGKKYCSRQCELDYKWSKVKDRLSITGDPGNTDFPAAKNRAKRFLSEMNEWPSMSNMQANSVVRATNTAYSRSHQW